MDSAKLPELNEFITQLKSNPSLLHNPSLDFFKSYLQSLGARIPVDPKMEAKEEVDDIVESDVELDDADVVEPDNDPPQQMGDPSVEVTEEMQPLQSFLYIRLSLESCTVGVYTPVLFYVRPINYKA